VTSTLRTTIVPLDRSVEVRQPYRIVVVGAGLGGYFAGRELAHQLKPGRAHITPVADTDGFLYQPLLPEVAVGALDPRTITVQPSVGSTTP
jgi:NADH:ubiquinone reductase (H+-translocating)